MVRRRIGSLLVTIGLVFMAWPVVTWLYGLYWQARLDREFASARKLPSLLSPAVVYASTPPVNAPTPPRKDVVRTPPKAVKPTRTPPVTKLIVRKTAVKKSVRRTAAVRRGAAVARLRIQRIGLNAVVVEGIDRYALRRGPGRLPKTGMPGEWRNCAIAAHRDGWFQRLPEVRVGDAIWVETPEAVYKYAVREKRVVTPDRSDLLEQGLNPVLTLITCTGPGYPRSRYRLLVFCDLRAEYPQLSAD
jgi:LPXTG-site transpeptidase (sortase) family protein